MMAYMMLWFLGVLNIAIVHNTTWPNPCLDWSTVYAKDTCTKLILEIITNTHMMKISKDELTHIDSAYHNDIRYDQVSLLHGNSSYIIPSLKTNVTLD